MIVIPGTSSAPRASPFAHISNIITFKWTTHTHILVGMVGILALILNFVSMTVLLDFYSTLITVVKLSVCSRFFRTGFLIKIYSFQ